LRQESRQSDGFGVDEPRNATLRQACAITPPGYGNAAIGAQLFFNQQTIRRAEQERNEPLLQRPRSTADDPVDG
jgi:hypothetical protein